MLCSVLISQAVEHRFHDASVYTSAVPVCCDLRQTHWISNLNIEERKLSVSRPSAQLRAVELCKTAEGKGAALQSHHPVNVVKYFSPMVTLYPLTSALAGQMASK